VAFVFLIVFQRLTHRTPDAEMGEPQAAPSPG